MIPSIGTTVMYLKRASRGGDAYAKPTFIPSKVIWHQPRRESMMTHVKVEYEENGKMVKRLVKLDSLQDLK